MAPEPALASKAAFEYCHSCGEQVMTYAVRSGEGVELGCSYCGLAPGRQSSQVEAQLECVMLVEDDEALPAPSSPTRPQQFWPDIPAPAVAASRRSGGGPGPAPGRGEPQRHVAQKQILLAITYHHRHHLSPSSITHHHPQSDNPSKGGEGSGSAVMQRN